VGKSANHSVTHVRMGRLRNRRVFVGIGRDENGRAIGINCVFVKCEGRKRVVTPLNLSIEAAELLAFMIRSAVLLSHTASTTTDPTHD